MAGLSVSVLSIGLITTKAHAITAMEYGLIAAATISIVTTGKMPTDLTINYSDPATGKEVKVPLSKCQSKVISYSDNVFLTDCNIGLDTGTSSTSGAEKDSDGSTTYTDTTSTTR